MKERIKVWIRASRPFALTASVIPVILGTMLAAEEYVFHLGYFVLSLLSIILLHTGANLLSDHDDYVNNVDTRESFGSSGVIFENLLTPKQIYRGGIIFLTLGALIGLYLSYKTGYTVLLLGLIGTAGGYSYTGKPLSLKYRGLGAPLIFMLFGPLMVLGSYYVQVSRLTPAAFLASIPVGLLTTAIMHANDIRDIQHDKKAGIKTLSILVGRNTARRIYYYLVFSAYISVCILVILKLVPYWSLICMVTLPAAVSNIKKLNTSDNFTRGIVTLDKATAKLHTQFGVLLILSILIPLIIK